MPASQHTPGPWHLNEQSPTRVTSSDGQTVAATYGGIVGSPEQVANGRLITSAPAMYEYIAKRAAEGDEEAQAIIDGVDG